MDQAQNFEAVHLLTAIDDEYRHSGVLWTFDELHLIWMILFSFDMDPVDVDAIAYEIRGLADLKKRFCEVATDLAEDAGDIAERFDWLDIRGKVERNGFPGLTVLDLSYTIHRNWVRSNRARSA